MLLGWIITIGCISLLFILLDKWILTPMSEAKPVKKVRYEDYVIGPDGVIHYCNYKKLDRKY